MPQEPHRLIADLERGATTAVCWELDGRIRAGGPLPQLVLPGSFNPLHHGHRELGRVAARQTGLPLAYELSIVNVDKPPLTEAEVRRRAQQFEWFAPLWVTRAPLFELKASLFPGAVFVVGADTATRLIDVAYYGGDAARMDQSFAQIRQHGCRFLVAARHDAAGELRELADLPVPAPLADLFAFISPQQFAARVSSTALRAAASS